VVLQIRIAHTGAASDEAAGLEMVAGTQPVMAQQPPHADPRLGEQAHRRIECDRLATLYLEIEFQMVLQVFADASQLLNHLDAERAQLPSRPDP
jgi:hypothetical protein